MGCQQLEVTRRDSKKRVRTRRRRGESERQIFKVAGTAIGLKEAKRWDDADYSCLCSSMSSNLGVLRVNETNRTWPMWKSEEAG